MILDSSRFPLFHGGQVFHQLVCPLTVVADDIDGLAGEEELPNLVEHFDKASTAYGMEISAEKTKLMTNITSGISTEIKVNGQKLETVTRFRYLGSVITDEGSKPKILFGIAPVSYTHLTLPTMPDV